MRRVRGLRRRNSTDTRTLRLPITRGAREPHHVLWESAHLLLPCMHSTESTRFGLVLGVDFRDARLSDGGSSAERSRRCLFDEYSARKKALLRCVGGCHDGESDRTSIGARVRYRRSRSWSGLAMPESSFDYEIGVSSRLARRLERSESDGPLLQFVCACAARPSNDGGARGVGVTPGRQARRLQRHGRGQVRGRAARHGTSDVKRGDPARA